MLQTSRNLCFGETVKQYPDSKSHTAHMRATFGNTSGPDVAATLGPDDFCSSALIWPTPCGPHVASGMWPRHVNSDMAQIIFAHFPVIKIYIINKSLKKAKILLGHFILYTI